MNKKVYVYKQEEGFTASIFIGWTIPKNCIEISDEDYNKLLNHELQWEKGVLIPYIKTQEEIDEEERIAKLNSLNAELATTIHELEKYDYIGVKISMRVATVEEYADEIAYTETLRAKVNNIKKQIENIN